MMLSAFYKAQSINNVNSHFSQTYIYSYVLINSVLHYCMSEYIVLIISFVLPFCNLDPNPEFMKFSSRSTKNSVTSYQYRT
jgi:hypothetical protein